jgi:hypothetical protein
MEKHEWEQLGRELVTAWQEVERCHTERRLVGLIEGTTEDAAERRLDEALFRVRALFNRIQEGLNDLS